MMVCCCIIGFLLLWFDWFAIVFCRLRFVWFVLLLAWALYMLLFSLFVILVCVFGHVFELGLFLLI